MKKQKTQNHINLETLAGGAPTSLPWCMGSGSSTGMEMQHVASARSGRRVYTTMKTSSAFADIVARKWTGGEHEKN